MSAHKKGFTLVELLVVIAIIAILSTVGLATYTTVQKSGRMSKRIQDLKAIQTALEIYYSVNKSYPTTGVSGSESYYSECGGGFGSKSPEAVINGLVPTYMPAFPADPSMNKTDAKSCYLYKSDGKDYKLLDYNVTEMTDTDSGAQPNLWDPIDPNHPNKCVNPPADDDDRRWAIWSSNTSRCW